MNLPFISKRANLIGIGTALSYDLQSWENFISISFFKLIFLEIFKFIIPYWSYHLKKSFKYSLEVISSEFIKSSQVTASASIKFFSKSVLITLAALGASVFFLIVLSEISTRYIGKEFFMSIIFSLFPIFLFGLSYLLIYKKTRKLD